MPNDNKITTNTNQTNTSGFDSPRETQPILLEKNATPPGAPNINAGGVERVAKPQQQTR
jgi:hypothetical protein